MSLGDGAVPQKNRASPRVLIFLAILIIGALGSGAWFLYKNSTDGFTNLLTDLSAWLDSPPETGIESVDINRLQTRYHELHTDLLEALDSAQSEKLSNFGRAKFRDQISLSLTRAEEAFEAGDTNDALRILEVSSEQWQQAISEIDAVYTDSTNTEIFGAIESVSESNILSDTESDSESTSTQFGNINGENSLLPTELDDEDSFANVILSIPVEQQRTSGEITLPSLPSQPEQHISDGKNQLGALESNGGGISSDSGIQPQALPQPNFENAIANTEEHTVSADSVDIEKLIGSEQKSAVVAPSTETEEITTQIDEKLIDGQLSERNSRPAPEVPELVPRPSIEVTVSADGDLIIVQPENPQTKVTDSKEVAPATIEHQVSEPTLELDVTANPEVTAPNSQPETGVSVSSDGSLVITQLDPSDSSEQTESSQKVVVESQEAATTTNNIQVNESVFGLDATPVLETAKSTPQPEAEVTPPTDGESVMAQPHSTDSSSESEIPQTATIENQTREPTLDLSTTSKSEIVALIPQPATEVMDLVESDPKSPESDSIISAKEQAKKQYENSLVELERIFPTLRKNYAMVPGNQRLIEDAQLKQQKAKEAYQEQDFNEARRLIELALTDAETAVVQEQNYYQLNLTIAKEAYAKKSVDTAKEAIERAATLRPDSNEVVYWRDQIEVLPKFLQAQQDAESARRSGDFQAEIDALERVADYSSDNNDALQRIAELKQLISDRTFTNTINRGMNALSDGNLEQAKRELTQARNQRPNSSQTAKLQKRIADTERQQEISRNLEAALKAWKNDDWNNTLKHYRRVLAIDPMFDEAVQGHDFATKIIGLQRKIDEFLSKPHRLSSANIAAAAKSVIDKASTYGVFSPKLKSSTESLARAIDEWRTPVPVRVLSDGKTNIGIRGVGKIGKTKERFIELLPGTYMFEGKREGYRSTLIELVVKNNIEDATEITVICYERS